MSQSMYVFLAVMVMAAVTYLIRLFPFLVFGRSEKPPEIVLYIGRVISPAAIAMLVVYCLKDVRWLAKPYGASELIASAVVIVLQLRLKNSLLSIAAGTVLYMYLIQSIF